MMFTMLLLFLLGLFASLIVANIEHSCNCIDDICIDAEGIPPSNSSCFFTVPVDPSDNVTDASDGYGYQACGNSSFVDMSGGTDVGVQANVSNCIQILEDLSSPSYVFLAAQLYNTSGLAITSYKDCYLWVLGGANATAELTDVDDNFFVGDMDLVFAMGNAISHYGNDHGFNSNMSVCGTLPNCGFYNSLSGSYSPAPEFAWCLGGEFVIASWVQNGGSFGHDLVSPDNLRSEQLSMSRTVRSTEDITESKTEKNPLNEGENWDLVGHSDLETRARDWFLRCDRGERTLAQCTQQFDTYCDEAGRLHSDDVICRFDCSCFRVPRSRCGIHYGFIYDCFDEDDEDDKAGAEVDTLELPTNASTTADDSQQEKWDMNVRHEIGN